MTLRDTGTFGAVGKSGQPALWQGREQHGLCSQCLGLEQKEVGSCFKPSSTSQKCYQATRHLKLSNIPLPKPAAALAKLWQSLPQHVGVERPFLRADPPL